MIFRFICGCETKEIIARENVKTMDTVEFDDEGFLICAIHKQRRYGWRSLPTLPGLKLADWGFKRWTPLEIEAYMLFDEDPAPRTLNLGEISEDRRDNRAPDTLAVPVDHLLGDDGSVVTAPPGEKLYYVPREGRSHVKLQGSGILRPASGEISGNGGGSFMQPRRIRDIPQA